MQVGRYEWVIDRTRLFQEQLVLVLRRLGDELGVPCTALLEGKEGDPERSYLGFGEGWIIGGNRESGQEPLAELRQFMRSFSSRLNGLEGVDLSLALESGLFGYFDYEWGLVWQRPATAKGQPYFFFRVCPINLVILPQTNRLVLEVFGEEENQAIETVQVWRQAVEVKLGELKNRLERAAEVESREDRTTELEQPLPTVGPLELTSEWMSNMPRQDYLTKVERIQEYIRAGDIFQAVFSQRFSRRVKISPWVFYQKLRELNPSPYLFCLKGETETLVGSSPELLVSTLGSRVRNRPIAGTRPRGRTEALDLEFERELRTDVKENAEHAMLVDLGRNDVGRVSRYGTVKVTNYAEVERFSHVMHLVSTVEGELASSHDGLSALQATFPAGTLSGAPKVRAMEILQDLEPEERGAYGGALGIVRWNGDVDFCITIRTLKITPDGVSVQAGGGIVFDSNPEKEYEETLHKAGALMRVVDECVGNH